MAQKAVTTILAKKKMLLARAGKIELPPIKQMVFGSGGVNSEGGVLEPETGQQELNNELYRKDISSIEIVSDTQIRYTCLLDEDELEDEEISELALADADGDLLTIKNFKAKGKDGDMEMTFTLDDVF